MDMDAITSAIKEESRKTLNTLLGEAVRSVLREECEKEDDKDDEGPEYDVIDNAEQENAPENDEDSTDAELQPDEPEVEPSKEEGSDDVPGGESGDAAPQEAPATDGDGDDEWGEFAEYTKDNSAYDLTGEKDYDKIVKVYKLLGDDDNIIVKRDGDTVKIEDGDNGSEYIVDLGTGNETSDTPDSGEDTAETELNESDIAGIDDDSVESTDISSLRDELNLIMQKLDDLEARQSGEDNALYENKKTRKPMKENKEILFEVDLGYTDNYQKKDAISGLSNNEPSRSGKSWDNGVPTGTTKPWAGSTKGKGQPFEKTIKEEDVPDMPAVGDDTSSATAGDASVEEQRNVGGFVQQNSVTASNIPNSSGRRARNAHKDGKQVTGTADNRTTMDEMVKKLRVENRKLKEAILSIRQNLSEAYVTNANLAKITKLFLENTTSQAEKVDIVNRFTNNAKTIEQSNALYESIKRELAKSKPTVSITESKTAKGTIELNEQKVEQPEGLLKTIDLMKRMENI